MTKTRSPRRSPQVPQTVMIGRTLHHYRIEAELGRGGMGVVYKAVDTRLDRPVALKFLASHLTHDPTARERFVREARSAAMLRHDNICDVHDILDTPDGDTFIVMPLYEGRSLKDVIAEGPLSGDRAIRYLNQIADGLRAAASKGLVHRDIKPGNLLITSDDRVKILDFGLAKYAGAADLTATRSTVGTMAYMSPEQVQGHDVDARSDLWSLGVVLYEMLTGEKPFTGTYEAAIVYGIVNTDVDLDHESIPDSVRPVLTRLLQRNPDDRIGSAEELQNTIARYGDDSHAGQESGSGSGSQLGSVSSRGAGVGTGAGRDFSGRRILPAIGAVVALAAVIWFGSVARSDRDRAPATQAPALRTFAVMPFENAGNNSDVQFLCDGIAESLINWLATVPNIKVISKSAAFRLRDDVADTEKLARELGVDGVIRGRLALQGEQIVVSVSLVDAVDDSQEWGERLVRPIDEVLFLERSIVGAIKDGLSLNVSGDNAAASASGGTDNAAAYDHYMRGHYLIQATDAETIGRGIAELRRSIDLDPSFARPHADIADAVTQLLSYGDHDEVLVKEAHTAATTAVALAPDLAEAHTALATIMQNVIFDWSAADRAYETAISLSPQSPVPYHRYADYLVLTLRFDRAREMAARAVGIDALDGNSMHAVGLVELFAGNFHAAVAAMREWNQFHPNSQWSYVKYALALSLDGQCEAAGRQAAKAEAMLDGNASPMMDSWLAWGYHVCENREALSNSSSRIKSAMSKNPASLDPGYAFLYAIEGDVDALVDFLTATIDAKRPYTAFAQAFALDYLGWGISDRMPTDPRYLALLDRLNFPKP